MRRGVAALVVPLVMVAAGACGGFAPATVVPVAPTTVWDGVYASAQATRGAAQYAEACSSCHAADLRGNSNAPSLVGVSFLFVWENRSLEEFFTSVRTRMPTNAPNSLPVQSYVDIVAYVLEANAFPAGAVELRADPAFLARIAITASGAGAAP